jgi:hypothetical protein
MSLSKGLRALGAVLIALSLVDLFLYVAILWVFFNLSTESDEFQFQWSGLFLSVSVWHLFFKVAQDLLAIAAGAWLLRRGT